MRNRYAPICCIWWDERKLSWSAIHVNRAAFRFLYVRVLKECGFDEEIQRQAARTVADCALSKEEITRILDATRNLKHWTILATGLALSVQEPPPTPDGLHQPASVVCEWGCRSGIKPPVRPHVFRHYAASWTMPRSRHELVEGQSRWVCSCVQPDQMRHSRVLGNKVLASF